MGGSFSRRDFLVRTGIIGAVVALGRVADFARPAGAQSLDDIAAVLRDLSRDTFDGFVSMVVPGPDPYSVGQGVTAPKPGAVTGRAADLLMTTFDHYFPLPDSALANVAVALGGGLGSVPLPAEIAGIPVSVTNQIDDAVRAYTESDSAIPVSLVLALVLNHAAVAVNPLAASGPFLSPFARLTYAEKLAAMEQLETTTGDTVAVVDANLPDAETDSVSGLIKFTANAVFALAALGAYSEYAVLDPATRTLTGRPQGWTVTGYQPDGPVAGWNEFRGYFRGHTEADR